MNKPTQAITELNLQSACLHIQKKFDTRSWWPKAQPEIAKREFKLMNGSAGALNVWCDRWLDLGQQRKLKRDLRR